jgi:predicted ABC-type ATPase
MLMPAGHKDLYPEEKWHAIIVKKGSEHEYSTHLGEASRSRGIKQFQSRGYTLLFSVSGDSRNQALERVREQCASQGIDHSSFII